MIEYHDCYFGHGFTISSGGGRRNVLLLDEPGGDRRGLYWSTLETFRMPAPAVEACSVKVLDLSPDTARDLLARVLKRMVDSERWKTPFDREEVEAFVTALRIRLAPPARTRTRVPPTPNPEPAEAPAQPPVEGSDVAHDGPGEVPAIHLPA